MSFDMSDPAQRAISFDRFRAGIGPTLGPQSLTRERRHRIAEQFTKERLEREKQDPVAAAKVEKENRAKFIQYVEEMRNRPSLPARPKPTVVSLARENLQRSLQQPPYPFRRIPRSKPATLKPYASQRVKTDPATRKYPSFIDQIHALFGGDQLSLARHEANRREIEERAYAEQERAKIENARYRVMCQILEVGEEKRSAERRELGPAPVGFHFIQVGENILLARLDDNSESGVLFGRADEFRISYFLLDDCDNGERYIMPEGLQKPNPPTPANHGQFYPSQNQRNVVFRTVIPVQPSTWEIEAAWAEMSITSVREMGAGFRRDTLDDYGGGGWRWQYENRGARRRRVLAERKEQKRKARART
ncbi:hypothetical protein R3P38DRAFT_2756302 [Favolaschia claudopus]|uniref:Uncharacterized protein n=1 Tax=Favolaschia claudopus TaxID=2862362 RepID=A0AAW0EH44_9AGAR